VKPYVVFEDFGHQTVDAAPNVRQQHKDIRAIVARCERSLDRVNLSTNPLDTGDQLLFFIFKM
jgi:hypothetical protein